MMRIWWWGAALVGISVMSGQTEPVAMVKPTLDVGLIVSDIGKSKAFYGDVLGLKPAEPFKLPDGSTVYRFQHGSSSIKLREVAGAPKYSGTLRGAIGFRLLTLVVDDFDGTLTRAAEHGGAPSKPTEFAAGRRFAFVSDPDGNQVEIVSLPAGKTAAEYDKLQVGLTVSDVEKSRAFYGKVMGLPEEKPQSPAVMKGSLEYIFDAGKSNIKFWTGEGSALPKHTGNLTDAIGLRYFTFIVADVDALYKRFQADGATIAMPPTDLGKLARIMMVADPDGNWIELAARARPVQASSSGH